MSVYLYMVAILHALDVHSPSIISQISRLLSVMSSSHLKDEEGVNPSSSP